MKTHSGKQIQHEREDMNSFRIRKKWVKLKPLRIGIPDTITSSSCMVGTWKFTIVVGFDLYLDKN